MLRKEMQERFIYIFHSLFALRKTILGIDQNLRPTRHWLQKQTLLFVQ